MKQVNNEKKKKLIRNILLIIIIILILLFLRCCKGCEGGREIKVDNQSTKLDIEKPQIKEEAETTDILGFDNIEISYNSPSIILANPKDNTVYMQFDVFYNNELIHSTDMIAPDHMIKLNVLDKLNRGESELIYNIDTYDIDTKAQCLSEIVQIVRINVKK